METTMERSEIISADENLKRGVINDIKRILKGAHVFHEMFYIRRFVDGVSKHFLCKSIINDCGLIRLEAECIKVVEHFVLTNELMNIDALSFADIFGNLKKELKEEKLTILQMIVANGGGKIKFDGCFEFTGIEEKQIGMPLYIDGNALLGLSIKDGKLVVHSRYCGEKYENDCNYISFDELDRMIDYVENNSIRTYSVEANIHIHRTINVVANSENMALKMAIESVKNNTTFNESEIEESTFVVK